MLTLLRKWPLRVYSSASHAEIGVDTILFFMVPFLIGLEVKLYFRYFPSS